MEKRAQRSEREGPPLCGHQIAIQELNRAHELISQLQALLVQLPAGCWSQLGGDVVKQILNLTTSALSTLQSSRCRSSDDDDDERNNKCSGEKRKSLQNIRDSADGHKRRRKPETWTVVTSVPYDDSHQWRKYGQKSISSARYPRSYYKCTYMEEQGCQAKKTVQQEDGGHADPPKFHVEYTTQHTCRTNETTTIAPFLMESSSSREASFHGFSSNSSFSHFQDRQHLSPLSVATASESHDKSPSSGDQAQACDPVLPELARTVVPLDMLGKMDTELNLFCQTWPWDFDLFMGADDGWYYI